MSNELSMEELTHRFYAVRRQRDKLMHALKVYRDAYGNCGSPSQQQAADLAWEVLNECVTDRSWEDVVDSGGLPLATTEPQSCYTPAATPRPWHVRDGDSPDVMAANNHHAVCTTHGVYATGATKEANAALICRAVNAWDEVLAFEARIGELMHDNRAAFKALTEQHPDPFALTPLEQKLARPTAEEIDHE